jgi:small subunit ribosomal protein S19
MPRSKWKIPHINEQLIKQIQQNKHTIKIRTRNSLILKEYIGLTIHIYNGLKYIPILITKDMVDHKFGEYAPTRKKKINK